MMLMYVNSQHSQTDLLEEIMKFYNFNQFTEVPAVS